ncbi:ACP S-malonyltransferase [Falsirhodobacter sp. 1013]|uniref:ACP S-malonyltransferase n=1 Tax=Falsirhodobacter sp. 1013 TaxID=3417566 RepID=UPI003EBCC0A7
MTLAYLFPGQSGQGADALRNALQQDAARSILSDLARVIGLSAEDLLAGPEERLFENAIAQPLVCALELAGAALLAEHAPEVGAGYSIGELAAYGVAGALAPHDVLRLARLRAEAMDAATTAAPGMAAVRGVLLTELEPCLSEGAFIAIRNGADRCVLAGLAEAVAESGARAERRGATVTPLAVRVASHTPLMAEAVPVFRKALEAADFRTPTVRVLAGIDGSPVLSRERAIDTLSRQLAEPVDWAACMNGLEEAGVTRALELPPGSALTRMLRDAVPIPARAMAEFRSAAGVAAWLERQI